MSRKIAPQTLRRLITDFDLEGKIIISVTIHFPHIQIHYFARQRDALRQLDLEASPQSRLKQYENIFDKLFYDPGSLHFKPFRARNYLLDNPGTEPPSFRQNKSVAFQLTAGQAPPNSQPHIDYFCEDDEVNLSQSDTSQLTSD